MVFASTGYREYSLDVLWLRWFVFPAGYEESEGTDRSVNGKLDEPGKSHGYASTDKFDVEKNTVTLFLFLN